MGPGDTMTVVAPGGRWWTWSNVSTPGSGGYAVVLDRGALVGLPGTDDIRRAVDLGQMGSRPRRPYLRAAAAPGSAPSQRWDPPVTAGWTSAGRRLQVRRLDGTVSHAPGGGRDLPLRSIAPTRRVALGDLVLPTDPAPGFGGILLGGIVARFAPDLSEDFHDEILHLMYELEHGGRIAQPRLRHRLPDRLRRVPQQCSHRLTGHGEQLDFEFQPDRGTAAQHVLCAVYAAGTVDPAVLSTVMDTVRKGFRWNGDGTAAHGAPGGSERSESTVGALADPVSWGAPATRPANRRGWRRAGGDNGRAGTGAVPSRRDIQRAFRDLCALPTRTTERPTWVPPIGSQSSARHAASCWDERCRETAVRAADRPAEVHAPVRAVARGGQQRRASFAVLPGRRARSRCTSNGSTSPTAGRGAAPDRANKLIASLRADVADLCARLGTSPPTRGAGRQVDGWTHVLHGGRRSDGQHGQGHADPGGPRCQQPGWCC